MSPAEQRDAATVRLHRTLYAAEAIAEYEKAYKIMPKDSGLLNNFAWVLATSTDDKLRNGAEAVQLAGRACELTSYQQAVFIGTLAAAHAEAFTGDAGADTGEPGVEHWHGASPDQDVVQLTIYEGEVKWLEAVTDAVYKAAPKK